MRIFRLLVCLLTLSAFFGIPDAYAAPLPGRNVLDYCKGCPVERATCYKNQLACAVWDGSAGSRAAAEAKACGDAIKAIRRDCDVNFMVPIAVNCDLCATDPGSYRVTEEEGRICCQHSQITYYYKGSYSTAPGVPSLPTR